MVTQSTTPATLAELDRLEKEATTSENWFVPVKHETFAALLAAARRLEELESALEYLHDEGAVICKAFPMGKDPWPETYGIDPVNAAQRLGWKTTP
jgi:hypothetical protein